MGPVGPVGSVWPGGTAFESTRNGIEVDPWFPALSQAFTVATWAPSVQCCVMLVEVPFYPATMVFENGEYVLNATEHWQPVMNGTSGVTPMSYRDRADLFWFFPRDWAIDAIERAITTAVTSRSC